MRPHTITEEKNNIQLKKETLAETSDIYELYEASVQSVEYEIEFIQNTYKEIRGQNAYLFREDFCGTASASCEWVRQGKKNFAISVDIDASVLEWGEKNRLNQLDEDQRARVHLIKSDVTKVNTTPVDLLTAFNFSYFVFKDRETLRSYFSNSYNSLKDDGIFFLDIFGGPEAQEETCEKTEHKNFDYIWEQEIFHPVTHFIRCHIHFHFQDGSKINQAFSYDWRLWTLPEIKELLLEAGFKKASVYWENEDDDGEGNGEFSIDGEGEADLAWVAYIAAEK